MRKPGWKLVLPALLAASCRNETMGLADRIDLSREEVTIGGERKKAWMPALGDRIELEVDVPRARPFLRFSTAVEAPRPAPRARVTFRVTISSDGLLVIVHQREVRSEDHNRWDAEFVDLAAWAGKRVSLGFEASPTKATDDAPWAERIRVAWGDPVVGAREAPRGSGAPPSVILIVVDALRYDYLGVNGFEGEISPNLDWLALESVRFEDAIAAAPWTKPSVASILTGLHPEAHGLVRLNRRWAEGLSEQAVTLAEVFRERGHRTAAYVANAWLSPSHGFGQGFDTYVVDRKDDALLEKLRSRLSSSGDAPTFVYLHLIGAHGPYRAPESDYRLLRRSPSLGKAREVLSTDPPRPNHLEMTPFATADEARQLDAWKAKYAAAVRQVDRRLGSLLNELRRAGDLDRTLVVLTADHGEEFLEHQSWEHGYELCSHQLRVPLWFRLPGAAGAGRRLFGTMSLVDLMPTVLGLAGLPLPSGVQGKDRSGWIEPHSAAAEPGAAFASAALGEPELHSLWTSDYRFEWKSGTGGTRLFDRNRDPEETKDVSALQPHLVARFKERLTAHLDEILRAGRLEPERHSISKKTREELRALGYLKE